MARKVVVSLSPRGRVGGTDHPGGGRPRHGRLAGSPGRSPPGAPPAFLLQSCPESLVKPSATPGWKSDLDFFQPSSVLLRFPQDAGQLLKQIAGLCATHPLLIPRLTPTSPGQKEPKMNAVALASAPNSALSGSAPAP